MNCSALIRFETFLSEVAYFQGVDQRLPGRAALPRAEPCPQFGESAPGIFAGTHLGNHHYFLIYKTFSHMACDAPSPSQ